MPNRQQAIIWTNADQIHWCTCVKGRWVNILLVIMNHHDTVASVAITKTLGNCIDNTSNNKTDMKYSNISEPSPKSKLDVDLTFDLTNERKMVGVYHLRNLTWKCNCSFYFFYPCHHMDTTYESWHHKPQATWLFLQELFQTNPKSLAIIWWEIWEWWIPVAGLYFVWPSYCKNIQLLPQHG